MDAETLINRAIGILTSDPETKMSFQEDIGKLKRQLEFINDNKYRLGVIGVTSAGKSTLINALLGEQILPAEAKPSSSQLVSCRKGPIRQAKIYFNNGQSNIFSGNKLDQNLINKYGNEQKNIRNKEGVAQIEIQSPNLPFDSSIVIVDSPGLDAYGLEGHEQITMETLLPSVDFCMFVTTCKTNSDDKMLSVLNSISRYGKPVIIVQNMIDSLKPTPDGKKSVKEVALDHMRRIQRIIDRSLIKDKTTVSISQISAINALKCRSIISKGSRLNDKGKILWKDSNFENFINIIDRVFKGLKPSIENARIANILKDVNLIISTIDNKLKNKPVLPPRHHNLKSELDKMHDRVKDSLNDVFTTVNNYINTCGRRYSMTQNDIDDILKRNKSWSDHIAGHIRDYNQYISGVCAKLNISNRDLRFNFSPSQTRTLRLAKKTVTERVKKKGFWGGFVRVITFGTAGYETITKEIDDPVKTHENAMAFLRNIQADFANQVSKWEREIKKTENLLYDQIDISERQYKAALERNLSIAKQGLVYDRLKGLVKDINLKQPTTSHHTNLNTSIEREITTLSISKQTYVTYKLSKLILSRVHQHIFESITDNRACQIYSWDEDSVNRFLTYTGKQQTQNISYSRSSHKTGIEVFINPQKSIIFNNQADNIFIFVNFTQPGAAQKQLASLNLSELRYYRGNVFFVIQDLQETLNGGDFTNALMHMTDFFKHQLGNKKFLIYPVHQDPLYAIIMHECQLKGVTCQNDEVVILKQLQDSFRILLGSSNLSDYSDIIRAFNTSSH